MSSGRFVVPASRTPEVIVPDVVFQTRTSSTLIDGFVAAVQTWMLPLMGDGGDGSVNASFRTPCHQTSK